ncbi:hypothetical protein JL09_g6813, partial [Pichia kudriavzevii]|uniref:T cell receptor delta diversity 1 n=1 Tax=Homo sapiens TaxID=9606 RepID=TRDD1_HUMAN
EI